MKKFFKNPIYRTLPVWSQHVYVTIKGLVYGRYRRSNHSIRLLKELAQNEKLSLEQLRSKQLQQLWWIVKIAGTNVPWYRELFKKIGFDPQKKFSFDEYATLPFLEKSDILDNGPLFLPDKMKSKLIIRSQSSGTTGNAIYVSRDRTAIGGEWAFAQRQLTWAGIPPNGRMAYLRDDEIVPLAAHKPPYWRYALLNRELWLSSFHFSEKTVAAYVGELQKFKPEGIFAYPSTIYWLSVFARDAGVRVTIPSLKAIIVSSEMLYDFQRQIIQKIFKVPVFDWYGSVERVNFIGTCEKGCRHLFPDYGYEEFIPVKDEPYQYELVGTGFLNTSMPLLRYRSGDIVVRPDIQCTCGRQFPVIEKIFGRNNDAILTPDGRRISILEIFDDVSTIQQIQIVQETRTLLSINIVPQHSFKESDKNELLTNLQKIIGTTMEFKFNTVERIPGGPQGKFRMIVSKL